MRLPGRVRTGLRSRVYQLSVLIHIVAATTWVGGLLFLALVAGPVARRLPPPERARLIAALGKRFLTIAWAALAVLIVTGVVNLVYRGATWESVTTGRLFTGSFGRILAVKLALVAVVLGLSALHDFRIGPASTRLAEQAGPGSPVAMRLRRRAAWIGVNTAIALVILALAVMLVRGVPR